MTSWIEGFIPFESTVNQAGLLLSLKITASQGGLGSPSATAMDLVLCVHLSKGRGYFLKNAGNRNSKVGKWSLNLAVCTQGQGQALWAGIHHVRQGERRAWADSSHPNLLLGLLSRFKTHPCHLYCDILLHLLTFLGFHNTLQGRLGKLI